MAHRYERVTKPYACIERKCKCQCKANIIRRRREFVSCWISTVFIDFYFLAPCLHIKISQKRAGRVLCKQHMQSSFCSFFDAKAATTQNEKCSNKRKCKTDAATYTYIADFNSAMPVNAMCLVNTNVQMCTSVCVALHSHQFDGDDDV